MTRANDITADQGPILVTVDPGARLQRFEGWGTSIAWWGHLVGTRFPELREPLARDLFGLEDGGLGLSVLRYNIGGGEDPSAEPKMELRARVPGWRAMPGGPLLPEADAGQLAVLGDALDQVASWGGVPHLETFANSPPWWMTVSGTVTGALGPTGLPADNLRDAAVDEFVAYLAEVTETVRDRAGVPVETVSPVNEPSSRWWRPGGRQEGSAYSRPLMARVAASLSRALRKRFGDQGPGVAMAEEWELADSVRTWDSFPEEVRAGLRAFNAHTYHGTERCGLRARIETAGIPLVVSEYGDGDPTGLASTRVILRDLRELRTARWVTWQAVGPDSWGFWRLNAQGRPVRLRKRAAFAHFTRFIRPGWRIIGSDDPRTLAALSPDEDELVVVVLNDRPANAEFALDLGGFEVVGDAERWDTDLVRGPGRELSVAEARVVRGLLRLDLTPTSVATVRVACAPRPGAVRSVRSGRVRMLRPDVGLALAVSSEAGSYRSGAAVMVAPPDPNDGRQQFDVEACGDGSLRLISVANGQALDVERGRRDAGARVVTWPTGTEESTPAHERWNLADTADAGVVRVRGAGSGRDLVVDERGPHGASGAGGAVLGDVLDPRGLWRIERV